MLGAARRNILDLLLNISFTYLEVFSPGFVDFASAFLCFCLSSSFWPIQVLFLRGFWCAPICGFACVAIFLFSSGEIWFDVID